ncbi:polysaccharide biosynthesis/export protein [Thalassotalea sp. M1531]|uniref:Polysaccharide biosynthesis/export protein n=1 Tax=Thalassotalea algicola TaxID=2716224 RepID=A0A7Y0LE98_9GAMM|nr:SLBB domain-containing protein [Thalassotalea algicola]NMP32940.1 polysaccharide biosynthesis/export protein [Thalassotalea algicola]
MRKFVIKIAALAAGLLISVSALTAAVPSQISPQQLEQFKKLPASQQRALAQSMGVDYNAIKKQLQGTGQQENEKFNQEDVVYPRGTKFDEKGNPIFPDDEFLEEEEEGDTEPKPFGYEVFANAPYTFAPTMDIAVPENYIIGAGDVLKIQMFGKENEEHELSVNRRGEIVLPNLGPFSVSGLTYRELKNYFSKEIKKKVLGVDVVVTLSELRSMRIFVAGDAFKPGPYVLSALSSVTHAIFAAGGINDIGSLRNIQVKRAGKLVTTLDLYDLLIFGDSSSDILLKSGDVVFIAPVGDRVTVDGEVRRPAIYELANKESFESVVKMAGGLLPSAYPSSTVVERFNQHNIRTIVNIDLTKSEAKAKLVKGGDVVKVMKTSEQYDESVTIIGAVARPGKYQWHKGQRVTDLLPNIHAYMLEDADLNYSIIVREKDIGRNIEVLQFSLFNALSDLNSQDNLLIQPHDRVLVFSINEKNAFAEESLDLLAMTQEELKKKSKEKAKEQYKDRMFWLEYGEEEPLEEFDELDESLKLAEKSMEELTGGSYEEEVDPKDIAIFSRQRLLTPVIKKLQYQAASGEPLQLIEVVGAVKYPGIYPLAQNSNVQDLVAASGGLLESAYLDRAEITRNEIVDNKAQKSSMNINLHSAIAGEVAHNISIQSKDRLNIHTIPAWQENHIIELRGEFLFPGKYTIQRGETLGQLIERAGGFSEFAYLDGSVFTREKLKQLELQNILKVSESLRMEIASKSLSQKDSQSIDYEQARMLLADLTKVQPVGRLVVDLPRISKDLNADILLENGDVLYVPTKQNSINVVGQVQVATSHLYRDGLDAHDYVELSGGVKQQADDGRIYVIKANGRVIIPDSNSWFSSNENTLSPGDTVVVPLDSYFMDNLSLWSTATQIIYQMAVAVASISKI